MIRFVLLFAVLAASCSSEPGLDLKNNSPADAGVDARLNWDVGTSDDGQPSLDAETGEPCEGASCSGHGVCEGPEAACLCDEGYHAIGLDCVLDDCTPTPQARAACDMGDLYWYDSCDARGELLEACVAGCDDDACQAVPTGVLALSEFEIRDGEPDRIYFESSVPFTATSTAGFVLPDDLSSNTPSNEPHYANAIVSVVPNAGAVVDHYFTLTHAYTFGDNVLLKFDGDDVTDLEGDLLEPFTHRHVVNRLAEPAYTGSTYYVDRATGDDNDDGSSEADAWRSIRHAAATAQAGDVVHIKAGNYGNERVVFANSGTANSRIKFEGYETSPGDGPDVGWTYGGQGLDANIMPLLDGGDRTSGYALNLAANENDYVTIKNLQITNYERGVDGRHNDYLHLENVIVSNMGRDGYTGHGFTLIGIGHNNTLERCIVENATATGFRLYGFFNRLSESSAYCDEFDGDAGGSQESMDYYTTLRGDWNHLDNVHLERVGDLEHGGHGITLKGDRDLGFEIGTVANNLAENSTIVHINGAVELRHRMVQFNTVRNVTILANPAFATGRTGGVDIRDGASDNIVEDSLIDGVKNGLTFFDGNEDQGAQSIGHNNVVRNTVLSNLTQSAIRMDSFNNATDDMTGNQILYCTIHNTRTLFGGAPAGDTSGNVFLGNIVSDVELEGAGASIFAASYNDYFGGFAAPAGQGNMSVDPQFTDAATGDFRLVAGSECVDAGTPNALVTTDRDGTPRPQGAAHDLGAYEQM